MRMNRQQMLKELKSIEEPMLVHEGYFKADSILRIISSEGGYRLEVDEFPIDGPFEISEDEFNVVSKFEEEGEGAMEFLDLSEYQFEMVEAGCEPEILYLRYQMNVREEGPAFSEDKEELEAILVEDVMDMADRQIWEDMSNTELEGWYGWHNYADT